MYKLYQLISLLIYPFIRILLILRIFKGKEDLSRYKEKLGIASVKRPTGKLIWFHAASIGEFNAILPVIQGIDQKYPAINILLTTVTLTSANIAKNNLPHKVISQFMPFDCINIVNKFISYWQPNLVIWTESELWPNMIKMAHKQCPMLLINARISLKSFSRWSLVRKFANFVLSKFSLILAQSQETKIFFEKLGIKDVLCLGNLKYMAANFVFEENELVKIKNQLKNRIVVMAASTHPGEEEIFAITHINLKKQYPQLLTIIAPRHPNRIEDVKNILSNLNVAIRSKKEKITPSTDILLVDTIGEFGLFFRLSEVVCIGGSWKKIAHSFIEAAKLKNLIIFGPNMNNSREVANEFLANKAAIFAQNQQEIEKILECYIKNPDDFDIFKNHGEQLVDKMSQVKEKILIKIAPYIDKL